MQKAIVWFPQVDDKEMKILLLFATYKKPGKYYNNKPRNSSTVQKTVTLMDSYYYKVSIVRINSLTA